MKGKTTQGGGPPDVAVKLVAQNRRARFDYAVEDAWEAGLALTGSEVKALREGNVNLSDAYAQPRGDELFLVNCRIGELKQAAYFGHTPLRDRKLLMRRSEIDRIRGKVEQRGFTRADRTNRLLRVIGPEGGDVVKVHQDAAVYLASLDPGVEVVHEIGAGRGVYAYLIDGAATFEDRDVSTGDAAKVTDQAELRVRARDHSELILVDVSLKFEAVGIWRGRV